MHASRVLPLLLALAVAAPLAAAPKQKTHRLTSDEERLFQSLRKHSAQQRTQMKLDPILCLVARQRARDLGRRGYFAHVNPDGRGPNFLVRRAGFRLPAFYDSAIDANNIESIAARSPRGTPANAVLQWLNSPPHREHTMGESEFARGQTRVGIGIAHFRSAPFATYYVFLSAPPNANKRPPKMTLLSARGKVLARTR